MFQAILHGKVRSSLVTVEVIAEWRSFYRETEDFLTAAVFSRLTYLPSDVVWSIIRQAVVRTASSAHLPEDVGLLKTRAFWPRWELTSPVQGLGSKEPDVFLEFERLCLVVEAKLGDDPRQQSPGQWAAEIAACQQREEADGSKPIWLLAIGGMGQEPAAIIETIVAMREDAERLLHNTYHYPDVQVLIAACSWRNLLAALVEEAKHIDPQSVTGVGYIISDLVEVLRFHGIRYTHWLNELLQSQVLVLRMAHNESLATLGEWLGLARAAVLGERPPWFIAPTLRGIRDQSILTLGRTIDAQ